MAEQYNERKHFIIYSLSSHEKINNISRLIIIVLWIEFFSHNDYFWHIS